MGLETKAVFLCEVDQYGYEIEDQLKNVLVSPSAGIYIAGRETPVLNAGAYYYRIERGGINRLTEVAVQSIEDLKGDIFDQGGELVLRASQVRDKARLLSYEPTVPVRGRALILGYVRDVLNQNAKYLIARHGYPNLLEVIKLWTSPSAAISMEEMEDKITNLLCPLRHEIVSYTGSRSWHIYLPSLISGSLRIEDIGDFRIRDWTEQNGHRFPD